LHIAGVSEVVGALVWSGGVKEQADSVPKLVDRAGGDLSEQRLELGEHLLNRVPVG